MLDDFGILRDPAYDPIFNPPRNVEEETYFSALIGDDQVLPCQFPYVGYLLSTAWRSNHHTGEKGLAFAVFNSGIDDALIPIKKAKTEWYGMRLGKLKANAIQWIESEETHIMSFCWCCDQFGLEIQAARRQLLLAAKGETL